jgi:hypothetical protein
MLISPPFALSPRGGDREHETNADGTDREASRNAKPW